MKVDYIALSVPIFFLLIGIEFFYGLRKKIQLYRLNDTLTNISLGIGQQVTGVFVKTLLFYGYLYLYENHRFASIETNFVTWIALFIGVDFFYYWFHRMSHEINALWAAHIVHHQSEDYNLSVALRQSWLQNAFSWVFYLPLALTGFDPVMFLTISSFNTLYQFWIHTRTIHKMGPLEWILNTPSHHRVHHGTNAKYLDKNHAGTLIIWDRLFGTFVEEEEEPHYGITKPLHSWNPVWANFHYWYELLNASKSAPSLSQKIAIFFKPPGWMPDPSRGFTKPLIQDDQDYPKYDPATSTARNYYLLVQFTIVLLVATAILFLQEQFSLLQLMVSVAWVVVSISSFGAIFEKKSWSLIAEYSRLILLPFLALLFNAITDFPVLLTLCLSSSLASLLWFYKTCNGQTSYHKSGTI